MDLTTECWIPVIKSTGQQEKVSPLQLWDDDILDVSYPRPDFQGAAWQFLIGLLQSTVAPEDEEAWRDVWQDGISPEHWQQALAAISPAMQFGAQKPAFLQSYEPLDSENNAISGLLIDAPGGNTLKLNKDHFIKRHCYERMCPHCAVMALFTVQTNSPAGGAGYRVGLRGGGPLTTLVVPEEKDSRLPLWKKLWLNVLPQEEQPAPALYPLIFPWLAATKTSEKAGNSVTPENSHPLQAYWGMPRRIEIDYGKTEAGRCDLCGEHHDACLLEMRNKNYGVQYDGWIHPLSPYRKALKDEKAPWLSLKGQPGGLSYKDWLGLSLQSEDKFNETRPAGVVRAQADRRLRIKTGLWCFAYDMDNAKARCWYQHRVPVVNTPNPQMLKAVLQDIVAFSISGLSLLRNHLKSALFASPGEVKGDFSTLDISYWPETEGAFKQLLNILAEDPERAHQKTRQAIREWEYNLQKYLFTVFDREVFSDPDRDSAVLRRQLKARSNLGRDYQKQKLREEILKLAAEPHV
ncbi:type I-E CRISPR-associated protein Cse1/CasA [Enterobacillus tribolii]|uniref:CRISPR-associated Cse1 family protein n=1 Tax=Enterobacillus tribolii TaxID=1487935 RepID=A0A370QRZ5_9GAMM|nr:type I-E CRISPR-associated protein Cse1/CasA [Enterobacillus tribolii]MBW7983476.1 type I-E CRISPR-associated protein Cse1/CasA [Enterobacillus tribolii]RDK92029.1 CRISPR-associated Cse1 family protein [Enterobacillus tribolii]